MVSHLIYADTRMSSSCHSGASRTDIYTYLCTKPVLALPYSFYIIRVLSKKEHSALYLPSIHAHSSLASYNQRFAASQTFKVTTITGDSRRTRTR